MRVLQETKKAMQLVSFKSVLKLRKNTNCMTPNFNTEPKNPTPNVYIKLTSKPCKSPKASNMAILKCALIVVFSLSFTQAWRIPPSAPQFEKSLESVPRPSRKLDKARGIKENKVHPSSGVGVGHGSGTGNGNGVGTGYGSGYGSGSGSGSGYGYGYGEGGSGTGVGIGYGSGSGSGSGSGYGSGYGSGSGPSYGHGNWRPPFGYWGCDGCTPYHDPNCGFMIPPPICLPGTSHTLPYPNSGLAKQDNHQPTTKAGETQAHAVDKNPENETPDPPVESNRPDNESQVRSGQGLHRFNS